MLAKNKQLTIENNNILGLTKIKGIINNFNNFKFENTINKHLEIIDIKLRNLHSLFMKMLKCILDEAE